MIFRQGGQDIAMVLYPAAIMLLGVLIILGLGVYQQLSAGVEQQVEAKDKIEEKNGDKRRK